MSVMPVMECTGITLYRNGYKVLDGVNARLPAGDFVAMVGPNGAGKTTLLKVLLGLLEADAGEISLFGQPAQIGRLRAGYVPQSGRFDTRFPVCVGELVAHGTLAGGWPLWRRRSASQEAAITQSLEACGIAHLRERRIDSLSGGEVQRALIARALAVEPQLLILDEPTANIDPSGQEALFDLLAELNRRMTILVVSHDLGLTTRYARTVWCLNRSLCSHQAVDVSAETLAALYGYPVRVIDHRPDWRSA